MKLRSISPAVVLLALAQPAHAQQSGEGAARNPADPGAQTPSLQYKSPFAGYRPFASGAVGPWREVNDEVARIGGWKAYAREAYEASKEAAPAREASKEAAPAREAAKPSAAPQESPGPKAR